ncbi:hypothetical protein BS47DRAFT_1366380 [Hydnum rufescens UP504]|uniref:Uncharacterized protein n=1 Tax=Hydnum rufescens UP504 TaxID=1448309 RepID=A0A9P6AM47_9AGAM|nr:hypothetical protein BS47DRAFT_1366380 [Hydnum rufescens UP504]
MCSVGIPLLLAFEASLTHGAGYHIDTYLHDKNAKRLALFCGGELFCFVRGLAKTWGDGFGSAKTGDVASGVRWSNHCGVSEPPTPQPEDFQMRGTPQSSVPQSSIPKSALPQSSLLQSLFSPSSFPQSLFPQSSFPQSSFPQALFPQSTSLPLAQPSPHPSVSSTMLSNRIVSLEIELQEVTEVLEAMTQSRDEACLALGNILAALNTIVENTQLGGT